MSDEPSSPADFDLARIAAVTSARHDRYFFELVTLADNNLSTAVGLLVNGVFITGILTSAKAMADEVDQARTARCRQANIMQFRGGSRSQPNVMSGTCSASFAARGKLARGRSAALPGHMDGMSAFRTLALARQRWRDLAALTRRRHPNEPMRIGEHIARLELRAGRGFAYEDLGHPDGHITLWGAPADLVNAVVEIVPAGL